MGRNDFPPLKPSHFQWNTNTTASKPRRKRAPKTPSEGCKRETVTSNWLKLLSFVKNRALMQKTYTTERYMLVENIAGEVLDWMKYHVADQPSEERPNSREKSKSKGGVAAEIGVSKEALQRFFSNPLNLELNEKMIGVVFAKANSPHFAKLMALVPQAGALDEDIQEAINDVKYHLQKVITGQGDLVKRKKANRAVRQFDCTQSTEDYGFRCGNALVFNGFYCHDLHEQEVSIPRFFDSETFYPFIPIDGKKSLKAKFMLYVLCSIYLTISLENSANGWVLCIINSESVQFSFSNENAKILTFLWFIEMCRIDEYIRVKAEPNAIGYLREFFKVSTFQQLGKKLAVHLFDTNTTSLDLLCAILDLKISEDACGSELQKGRRDLLCYIWREVLGLKETLPIELNPHIDEDDDVVMGAEESEGTSELEQMGVCLGADLCKELKVWRDPLPQFLDIRTLRMGDGGKGRQQESDAFGRETGAERSGGRWLDSQEFLEWPDL